MSEKWLNLRSRGHGDVLIKADSITGVLDTSSRDCPSKGCFIRFDGDGIHVLDSYEDVLKAINTRPMRDHFEVFGFLTGATPPCSLTIYTQPGLSFETMGAIRDDVVREFQKRQCLDATFLEGSWRYVPTPLDGGSIFVRTEEVTG